MKRQKKLSSPPPPSVNNRCFSNTYSESGRSMLEVIAVLAVAAVIGAGGVEGFTSAMRKYRANELITEAAGRALAVSQQLMVGKELKDTDFGGYPATDTGHGKFPEKPIPLTGDEFFKIPITGMDKPTCDQMKAIAGGSLRRVDCKEENGKVTAELIYQKDLSETAGTIPGDTDGTSTGGNAATRSYDNNREGCEEAGYQYCSNNICITKEETCESGSASCAQYPGTSTLNSGGHAGKADDGETMCYCPGGQVYTEANGCIPACSGHGTLDKNEDCVCQGGYCGVVCENQVTCQHGTWTVDKCECDENWYGPLCDSDCDGFKDNDGYCYSCDMNCGAAATLQECDKCSNREMMGNKCTLSTAACNAKYPTEGGIRDNYGNCYSCSHAGSRSNSKDECDKCSNREMIRYNGNNYCVLSTTACNALYPTTGGFRNDSGTCYSCSDSYGHSSSKDACDKCSNREMIGDFCALTTATCNTLYPTEGGFRDYSGNCLSCSSSGGVSTSKDECDKCSNRIMDGKWCILTTATCNALYPTTGGFRNDSGTCYSCSVSNAYLTTKDECDKCGNLRYMSGRYCKKK